MSPTQQYFSNAVGSVNFVPADGYLLLRWTGHSMTSPEFRALYVHAHNLLLRHHLRGVLADHRAMPAAPDPADRTWLLHTWLPQAVAETEFRRYAVVPTLDPAHRLHTDVVKDEICRSVTTELFAEVAAAVAWLRAA